MKTATHMPAAFFAWRRLCLLYFLVVRLLFLLVPAIGSPKNSIKTVDKQKKSSYNGDNGNDRDRRAERPFPERKIRTRLKGLPYG